MTTAVSVDDRVTFRCMATDVTLRVVDPSAGAVEALERARAVFERVASACTRFDPSSPLMLANAEPTAWHDVPVECARAVAEASRAYRETGGVFDPRVLDDLLALGYDRTLPFAAGTVRRDDLPVPAHSRRALGANLTASPWRPRVEQVGDRHRVHLDGARIDLGGLGKGLAVRWAARELRGAGSSALVEAGGDCQLAGPGPAGEGWLVGMEDPLGGTDPLAVFALQDVGCATSSVRIRSWVVDGHQVHHLIDPRTGLSGGEGLAAVTVIHPDAAWAEVWSKTLFLSGIEGIEQVVQERELAAAWVTVDGKVSFSRSATDLLVWEAAHA